jgi:hypothetical protein
VIRNYDDDDNNNIPAITAATSVFTFQSLPAAS